MFGVSAPRGAQQDDHRDQAARQTVHPSVLSMVIGFAPSSRLRGEVMEETGGLPDRRSRQVSPKTRDRGRRERLAAAVRRKRCQEGSGACS
ncbi:hypothetical protein IFM12275_18660 [Nocardia sputorum]|nr:hypothetical protein IFM12275_18660 [Nocardia sputorum]